MDALTVVLACAVALIVLVLVASCLLRANRLDRLHVRTDAAWAALDDALSRRARAVGELSSAAAEATGRSGPAALSAAAELALRAAPGVREDAENELGRALGVLDRAALDPVRVARLADAQQRVVIARRVYNDAVRDTLALRSRRMVRWLRLTGTAPLPRYFDIAEPTVPGWPGQDDGAGA